MVGANGGLTDAASGSGADRVGILSTHAHLFFLLSSGPETCSWRPGSISGKKAASGASSAGSLLHFCLGLFNIPLSSREGKAPAPAGSADPDEENVEPSLEGLLSGTGITSAGVMKRLWWQQSRSRSGAG